MLFWQVCIIGPTHPAVSISMITTFAAMHFSLCSSSQGLHLSCIDDVRLLLVLCIHAHLRLDGFLPNGQFLLDYIPIAASLQALSASNSVFWCISLLLALCIHAHLRPDGLLPDDQLLLDYISIAAPPSVPVCSILVPNLQISRHSCEHSCLSLCAS